MCIESQFKSMLHIETVPNFTDKFIKKQVAILMYVDNI